MEHAPRQEAELGSPTYPKYDLWSLRTFEGKFRRKASGNCGQYCRSMGTAGVSERTSMAYGAWNVFTVDKHRVIQSNGAELGTKSHALSSIPELLAPAY